LRFVGVVELKVLKNKLSKYVALAATALSGLSPSGERLKHP
jgi:hypothetical protein